MISGDDSALRPNSAFRGRLIDYGKLFDELWVIILTDNISEPIEFGGNIHVIPANSSYKSLAVAKALWRSFMVARRDKSFVVSSQEEFGAIIGFCLRVILRTPWQAQVHSDVFNSHFQNFSFKNKTRTFLARLLLPHATCIRVVSARIKRSLEENGITKVPIVVLPIFVDATFKKSDGSGDGEKLHVLMVSRLAKEKNILMALKAVAKISNIILHVVGDGPEKNFLTIQAKTLGVSSRVIFEGWHDNTDEFYNSTDVYMLTSWYEGYGMSVVEALVHGMPIVMTDVGIARDVVRDNVSGLLVRPGDEKHLEEALLKLQKDKKLRERLSNEAKKIVDALPDKNRYLKEYKESFDLCAT